MVLDSLPAAHATETGPSLSPIDPVVSFAEAQRSGELVKDELWTRIWIADVGFGLSWWKEYIVPAVLGPTRFLAKSRGAREWGALVAMEEAGVPIPQPLLFAEWRRRGSVGSSLVVTRDVPDAIDLGHLLADTTVPEPTKVKACESVGRLAARIHGAGFAHFRLVPRNLLVGASSPYEAWTLDTPYSCCWKGLPPRQMRHYDLTQVCSVNGGIRSEHAEYLLRGYVAETDERLDTGKILATSRRRRKTMRIVLHTFSRLTGHSP